jgi:excisionase family DNA binding protein
MYKVSQVAEMFGVSRQTVLDWINKGVIQAVKPLKEYRIPKEEVERLKNNAH